MNESKDDALAHKTETTGSQELSRRGFFAPAAAVAASAALPAMLTSGGTAAASMADPTQAALAPLYYPLSGFTPDIDLTGKVAVVTGASRGIGRATAEALDALGVDVIGTSRDVRRVPNRPSFPLMELDITEPKSVQKFAEELDRKLRRRKLDILINNAGRFVLGTITASRKNSPEYRQRQLQLGMDTLCNGHIHVTDELLPLMPTSGYARVLFTASVAAYLVGGLDPLTIWIQGYLSAKRALLGYANSLRGALLQAGSHIQVSTVNPYFIATAGAEHPNPIYTEHVLRNGFTDEPPSPTPFNQFLGFIRQRQAAGLPASFVGEAYAQLLSQASPPANVVVSSTVEPFATQAGNQLIESIAMGENLQSAMAFGCA